MVQAMLTKKKAKMVRKARKEGDKVGGKSRAGGNQKGFLNARVLQFNGGFFPKREGREMLWIRECKLAGVGKKRKGQIFRKYKRYSRKHFAPFFQTKLRGFF